MSEELPYIETKRIIIDRSYNPKYGDNRICECGHPYYRHFDTYDEMYPCGCKYCSCQNFIEADPTKTYRERDVWDDVCNCSAIRDYTKPHDDTCKSVTEKAHYMDKSNEWDEWGNEELNK